MTGWQRGGVSHWAVMGGEFVVMGGLWQKYWYHCHKRDFKAGTGCRGLWCLWCLLTRRRDGGLPVCTGSVLGSRGPWNRRSSRAVRSRKQALSLKRLSTGLIRLWAKAWPLFTDERPAIFRAFAHVLGVCLSHILSSPSPLYSSFTDASLS